MISKSNIDHLDWLVKCRSRNQKASLKLLKMLSANAAKIKKKQLLAARSIVLIAISFSLWRAVFLAEGRNTLQDRYDHALQFLGTLVADNAIAYTQDKNSREWTFWYYVNNARFRLDYINGDEHDFTAGNPQEEWERLQTSLEKAIVKFGKELKTK